MIKVIKKIRIGKYLDNPAGKPGDNAGVAGKSMLVPRRIVVVPIIVSVKLIPQEEIFQHNSKYENIIQIVYIKLTYQELVLSLIFIQNYQPDIIN